MRKTMSKAWLGGLISKYQRLDDLYDALYEAGISLDIYYDSDGKVIRPGDLCMSWDVDGVQRAGRFIGFDSKTTTTFPYCSDTMWSKFCRKIPTEVWEPIPLDDIDFDKRWSMGFRVNADKWAKWETRNGRLEGVRE